MIDYLSSINKQLTYYKSLGEKTLDQLNDEQLNWRMNEECNSVATIVKHLAGNMLSRWTDFLETDGEKVWRNRDAEFDSEFLNKKNVIEIWNKGWTCFLNTLNMLKDEDLQKIVFIRNEGHSVVEAINRQLCHYPYHIGQMIMIGKILKGSEWNNLSIPKGKSSSFNSEKFSQEKSRKHFTDNSDIISLK